MNLESLGRSNKVRVAVGVLVVLAVAGGAYLAFAEQEPAEISNAQELQQVRENPSGNYVLVDDIDLSHIDNFEPIEDFTGTFDGNGHTISGLTINRPGTDRVGMFRTVNQDTRFFGLADDKGVIKNLTLHNANVTGGENVGGLVGINLGILNRTYIMGKVTGKSRVGAVAGFNSGKISESQSRGNVTGIERVGGLVGTNEGGEVDVSNANVTVVADRHVGGLVGFNEINSIVINSYATGDVSGDRDGVGGLVGVNMERSDRAGKVSSSYATGHLSGDNALGLVGANFGDDAEITDSYWDVNSTGSESSHGGIGLTTEEMTGSAARENMEGFDFEAAWRTTEVYPRLAWQAEGDE